MTQQNHLFPLSDADALIQGFLQCTLPKTEWTHEAHLLTGMYLLSKFGDQALPEMRKHIRMYNVSVGGINDDTQGYHETLTVFWLSAIQKYGCDKKGKVQWTQNAVDNLLDNYHLSDRNLWKKNYSVEVVKSVEARRGFVPPDLMGL